MDLKTEARVVNGKAFVQVYVRNATASTELILSSVKLAAADGLVSTDLGREYEDHSGGENQSDFGIDSMSFNVDVSSSAPAVDGGRGPYLLGETMSVDRTFSNPDTHTLAALDHTVALGPGDERQFLYVVEPDTIDANGTMLSDPIKNDGSAVGVVHVQWRTAMCETGAFKSATILTPISRRRDVEVALLKPAVADGKVAVATPGGIPAVLCVGQCCAMKLTVTNNTNRPRSLQLTWRLPAAVAFGTGATAGVSSHVTASSSSSCSSLSRPSFAEPLHQKNIALPSIVVHGLASQSLGNVTNESTVCATVNIIALAAGLHSIEGFVVVDEANGQEFPQPSIGTIFVQTASVLDDAPSSLSSTTNESKSSPASPLGNRMRTSSFARSRSNSSSVFASPFPTVRSVSMSSSNGTEGNAEVNEVDMDADDGNDEDKVQQHTERIQQEIKNGTDRGVSNESNGGDITSIEDNELPPIQASPMLRKQTTGGGVHGDGSNDAFVEGESTTGNDEKQNDLEGIWESEDANSSLSLRGGSKDNDVPASSIETTRTVEDPQPDIGPPPHVSHHTVTAEVQKDIGETDDDPNVLLLPSDDPLSHSTAKGNLSYDDGNNDYNSANKSNLEDLLGGASPIAISEDPLRQQTGSSCDLEGTVENVVQEQDNDPLMESVLFGETSIASSTATINLTASSPFDTLDLDKVRDSSNDRDSMDRLSGVEGESLLLSPSSENDLLSPAQADPSTSDDVSLLFPSIGGNIQSVRTITVRGEGNLSSTSKSATFDADASAETPASPGIVTTDINPEEAGDVSALFAPENDGPGDISALFPADSNK